jgi:uncharacterized Zn finger protein (UPF0148 family)
MALARAAYRPRDPERGVLHTVVRAHLETFLQEAAHRADGHGFARFSCDTCAFERLVPFSRKGRGFCPSCGGRRMTERAVLSAPVDDARSPRRGSALTCPARSDKIGARSHGSSAL